MDRNGAFTAPHPNANPQNSPKPSPAHRKLLAIDETPSADAHALEKRITNGTIATAALGVVAIALMVLAGTGGVTA